MKAEHPILLSTAMVRAIIAGRKTVTRRIIKESFNGCLTNGGPHPCPNEPLVFHPGEQIDSGTGESVTLVNYPQVRALFHCSTLDSEAKCPFGKVGDLLWVRETWFPTRFDYEDWLRLGNIDYIKYAADGTYDPHRDCVGRKWRPSIHMPKQAARIWLEVTSITVEELDALTDEEANKEGIHFDEYSGYWFAGDMAMARTPRDCFREIWTAINGEDSWAINPWVWRIEFKVLSTTGKL